MSHSVVDVRDRHERPQPEVTTPSSRRRHAAPEVSRSRSNARPVRISAVAVGRRARRAAHASGGTPMNALRLLRDDHAKLKKLLAELEDTTERATKTRAELFATIHDELTVHEIIEEEIFYPTLRQHPKAKEIVLEGYEEHGVVDTIMAELESLPTDDETWGPKAKVMIENIRHHIDEEEGEMFEKARQVLEDRELEQLGEQMAGRKSEAREQVTAGRV
jgi:hemerythrin-like domain-containing protein